MTIEYFFILYFPLSGFSPILVGSYESKGNDMLEKLLAQVFGCNADEQKLDIIKPDMSMKVTFGVHAQFVGLKGLEEEMCWLMKEFSERFDASRPKIAAAMTKRNADLVASLAAELPKKGEDANWSNELRVAVWKRRQRDEVRANLAQARRIEELEQQILDLTDQLEEARFNTAVAEADANGDVAVVVAEDPAARTEALTGVVQALADIAQARTAEADSSAVAPEAPKQEVAPIAELLTTSEVVDPAPVEESAAAWRSFHSFQSKAHLVWAFTFLIWKNQKITK